MNTEARARDEGTPQLIHQIRRALEGLDLEAFVDLYAEDAILEEVSCLSPPTHPHRVRGREAILKRLQDELLRDPVSGWSRRVTHSAIVDEIETDDALAYTEVRTYAAGDKVVAQHLAHKRNGLIQHDRMVIAWDETP